MEQLDSRVLLDFLGEVGKELKRSITLVAVGGTAKFRLRKSQVAKRAEQVEYVGREESYNMNLTYVLENFFR